MNTSPNIVWKLIAACSLSLVSPASHGAQNSDLQTPNPALSSNATKEAPFVNTLEMKFVPVPITGGPTTGQRVLFGVWDTRVQDYEAFVKETGHEWPKPGFEQEATHPAVMVSWEDAQLFCTWLTERERKAGKFGTNEEYRLPSDHEWSCAVGVGDKEDAAKLPSEKTRAIRGVYPWGKQWPPPENQGNFAGEELKPFEVGEKNPGTGRDLKVVYHDPFPHTSPVGSFPANSLGLYDLVGNVSQWCQDYYEKEQRSRVHRGASWHELGGISLASCNRRHSETKSRLNTCGFRCVIGTSTTLNTRPAVAIQITPNPVPAAARPVAAADVVKTSRNSLVFVTGTNGSGSGFLAKYKTGSFLFTNAHVAAGVRGAAFKTLDGKEVKLGEASCAVGHDIFLVQAASNGVPLELMDSVDENTSIGDEVVVLGNAEGAGVINTINGKIVGLGPNLVEVDAPFQPGNSGSPIIHLKTGKVIGVATYAVIRKYDPSTKEKIKVPVVRRFGYRLDSISSWQPVNWAAFLAQATEMESIEKLTTDLAGILKDLTRNSRITRGAHNNPVIKNRIDSWLEDRAKKLSPRDAAMVDQSFLSFLKITCQNDVTAALQHLTYDYFQRDLADQQRERDEIAKVFDEIIQNLRNEK